MSGGLVDAAIVGGQFGDVAVGGAGRDLGQSGLDATADPDLVGSRFVCFGVVDPPVHPVDDEV